MAISPQRLTIYLYSAHRAVVFAIAQLSCYTFSLPFVNVLYTNIWIWIWKLVHFSTYRQSTTRLLDDPKNSKVTLASRGFPATTRTLYIQGAMDSAAALNFNKLSANAPKLCGPNSAYHVSQPHMLIPVLRTKFLIIIS